MDPKNVIKKLALESFDQVGFTPSQADPKALRVYENWLSQGHHASMKYLERHLPQKKDPNLNLKGAQSWIVVLSHYDTAEPLSTDLNLHPNEGWVARYCRGEDYHLRIHKKLDALIRKLQTLFPKEGFWAAVDSKPVSEREIGYRAGLGWIGKNSCLIDPDKGSFFFIAEILTTLALEPDKPIADHCGKCTRCIDACPTQAITSDRTVDSRLCISYWTIEAKTSIPPQIGERLSGNLFGCDICQDVCPWNQKARKQNLPTPSESGVFDLRELLNTSNDILKDSLENTSMNRTHPDHLKETARNIMTTSGTK